MRDVLQIGIPEEDRRRQKRDQDAGKKLTSRVSLILRPEKAHKQDVKGILVINGRNFGIFWD